MSNLEPITVNYTEEELWELSLIISENFTYVYNQEGFGECIKDNSKFYDFLKWKSDVYERKLNLELHMPWLYKDIFADEGEGPYSPPYAEPFVQHVRNMRKEYATLDLLMNMVYRKPLEQIPLWVNDPVWKRVAVWRLKVGK